MENEAKNIPNLKKDTLPFYEFKNKHSKKYINAEEEVYRTIVYTKNQDKINKNN